MPRVAAFRIDAIRDLFQQLRYAPAKTRQREMDAIEALVADIEPQRVYPEDFIVFRITGYRPEGTEPAATLVGEALLGELANLVQRLSQSLELPADYRGREALTLEEVGRRLKVSRKTIQRYRRQGLVCHDVVKRGGRRQIVCFADALQRFVELHRGQLERAARFTRIDSDTEASIITEAKELRESLGLSLNQAANRLARRHGRAAETVRMLLRRADRRGAAPIFGEHGPLSARDGRLAWRAHRLGVPVGAIARRFGKTTPSIHRAINRARADRLRHLALNYVNLPTFEMDDAADIILAAHPVAHDLDQHLPHHDALLLLEATLAAAPVPESIEDPLLAGYNFLKRRARSSIDALGPWPKAAALDAIETDLRWASLLHRRLVGLGLPAAVRAAEQHVHRHLAELPGESVVSIIRLATQVVARTIESIDPSRGQRLERLCAQAMDRALAVLEVTRIAGRASARHAPGALPVSDLLEDLCPWDGWLRLRRSWRGRVAELEEAFRRPLEQHFGLAGTPPRSCADLAREQGITISALSRKLRAAEQRLRAMNP